MKNKTRNVLETPFTSEQIKQRKGLWGKTLDYIEGHSVIQRLNQAFESDWSFEITQHSVYDEEVVAIGKLTVGTITKMQFGSNKVTRDSENRKALSLGDDLKAASTDALKKCASLLGIGLHLYGDVGGNETPAKKTERAKPAPKPTTAPATKKTEPAPQPPVPAQPAAPSPKADPKPQTPPKPITVPQFTAKTLKTETEKSNGGNVSGSNGDNGNGNGDRITPKQLNYVLALGKRNNLTAKSVDGLSREMFALSVQFITKHQASTLISRLSE